MSEDRKWPLTYGELNRLWVETFEQSQMKLTPPEQARRLEIQADEMLRELRRREAEESTLLRRRQP